MSSQIEPTAAERYFKVLADGTQVAASDPRTDHVAVLDTRLNLEFYVNSVGMNNKAALNAGELKSVVDHLDILGGGWRIADVDEAASIIRRDRYNPAVDQNLFTGIKAEWHVTSTPAAWAPASAAWWVGFFLGGVSGDILSGVGWALAVRPAGQSLALC